MDHDSALARARIAFAVAARETSDFSRGQVGDIGAFVFPGERIRAARRLRVMALTVLDRAVLVELTEGAPWATVAQALGMSEQQARGRYEQVFTAWQQDGPAPVWGGEHDLGLRSDGDRAATVAAVDAWFCRHREPWDGQTAAPLARALPE